MLSLSENIGLDDYDDGQEYEVTVATNDLTIKRRTGSGGLTRVITNGANVRRRWKYYDQVSGVLRTSPDVSAAGGSGDEMHIVVVDSDGTINGTSGEVLEKFESVSKASDAKDVKVVIISILKLSLKNLH